MVGRLLRISWTKRITNYFWQESVHTDEYIARPKRINKIDED